MRRITDAVVLMAGTGSRLRASGEILPKPLVPIFGRPLICYIAEALAKVGVRNLYAIVGAHGDALVRGLRPLVPSPMELHPISNPDWQKQNGISVLCAAGKVSAPFFLTMGDHLFDPSLLERVVEEANPGELNLAVDHKIEAIFDLDDAMKVQTTGDRVSAIGKALATYDAIDTGVFLCPNELFDYLGRAKKKDGDCSLADGVRLMAEKGKVRAVDIREAWWQDVDTFEMRMRAEEILRQSCSLAPAPGPSTTVVTGGADPGCIQPAARGAIKPPNSNSLSQERAPVPPSKPSSIADRPTGV